jgi:6-phosphogluconolactonase
MMRTAVIFCDDQASIASRALDLAVDGLRSGIALRGEAHLALTGGSSAAALFALFRSDPRADRVDWTRVHVWQGDERFVPVDHTDSNWAAALRDWLDADPGSGVLGEHRHPIPVAEAIAGGHDAAWAAARYASEIERLLPRRDGTPAFDIMLLGVGSDGHILSTFPGTAPIGDSGRAAMAVAAPTHIEPHVDRVTVASHLLRAARQVLVMVPGSAKAGIIATCFGEVRDPQRWPAQLALRSNAVWLLEPESAANL